MKPTTNASSHPSSCQDHNQYLFPVAPCDPEFLVGSFKSIPKIVVTPGGNKSAQGFTFIIALCTSFF